MASLKAGLKRFLYTASSICYPAAASIPYKEETLWDGPPEPSHLGYAHAKRAGIALLQSAARAAWTALRSGHAGEHVRTRCEIRSRPKQRGGRDASQMHREARDRGDETITCWGSGEAIREFLFVEDAAQGILQAASCHEPSPLNLGTGQETTIGSLVETACLVSGFNGDVVWDTTRPEGAPRVCMDISRMRNQLAWCPSTSILESGLRKTLSWWEPIHKGTLKS